MTSLVVFVALAAILLVSSLLVILHRNPVSSALFLVLAFCSLAGLYLLLQAEFLGMVQIVVYAGAIMVLFLFVIMYLNLKHDLESGLQITVRRGLGWIVGGVLVAEGALMLARRFAPGPVAAPELTPAAGNTQAIGELLFSRYLFPFEITSLVLIVAMIGAVVISKSRRATEAPARASSLSAPRAETPGAAISVSSATAEAPPASVENRS